jgi:pyruvate carboxylase
MTTYYHIDTDGNLAIGQVDGAQTDYIEIGNATEAKQEAERRAGSSLTWQQQRGELLATQTTYHTTENDIVTFDIPAIEAALVAAGATAEEADALTDILHEEGWGGAEYDLTPEVFAAKVAWYREERAN